MQWVELSGCDAHEVACNTTVRLRNMCYLLISSSFKSGMKKGCVCVGWGGSFKEQKVYSQGEKREKKKAESLWNMFV